MSGSTPPPGDTGDGFGGGFEDHTDDQPGQPPPAGTPGQDPAWQQPTTGASEPGRGQPAPAGLQPSNIGKRIGAAAIDFIGLTIVLLVVLVPILVAVILSDARTGGTMIGFGRGGLTGWVIGLVVAAIELAYFVFLEGSRGQTVGKMLLSMKVYKFDGSPMDYEGAFKRRFWFFIGSLIPPLAFLGAIAPLVSLGIIIWLLVTMSNDQLNRGYHDVFGNSIVVDTQ